MMTKLNDLQTILLSSASQRDEGSLYPLPTSIAGAGARLTKGIAALLQNGLAEESASNIAAQSHRSDDDVTYGLFVTDTGRATIGVGEPDSPEVQPADPVATPKQSKTATVLALLSRGEGATLADLIAATGWLPHTTRAALTGLRKKSHAIEKIKVDGVTRYSIASVT